MRTLMGFTIVVLVVAVFILVYLTKHAVSTTDIPPLDAQQQEYQEENRRLIEQLIAAEKSHAPEVELEKIRKERREVNRQFFEYNKTRTP